MGSTGRKTKLTKQLATKICASLRKCYTRGTAAALAGISPSTLFLWLAKGEQGVAGYSEFLEQVDEAEASAQAELVDIVVKHAKKTPKFALNVVARRWPAEWSRHDNVTLSHGLAEPPSGMNAAEELAERFAKLVTNLRELQAEPAAKPAPKSKPSK